MRKLPRAILLASFLPVLLFAHIVSARAQFDFISVDERLASASRSIIDGHVKDGFDRLESLLGQLDPVRDRDAYWRTATTLIEFLSQTENHTEATRVLNADAPSGTIIIFARPEYLCPNVLESEDISEIELTRRAPDVSSSG